MSTFLLSFFYGLVLVRGGSGGSGGGPSNHVEAEPRQTLTQSYEMATAATIDSLVDRLARIKVEMDLRLENGDTTIEINRPILEAMQTVMNSVRQEDETIKAKTVKVDGSIANIRASIETFFKDVGLYF